MRVVADTNVLISALVFGGLPEVFLTLAQAHIFMLATSPAMLDELDGKLRTKFRFDARDADQIRHMMEELALVVVPDFRLSVVLDDHDDDRVLECAVASRARFLLSGDRHLLRIGTYEGIEIITVRRFMDLLEFPH